MHRRTLLRALPFSLLAACASAQQTPAASPKPTLVVFITVDQMRADYFQRFDKQLTGGLRTLYDGGAVFLDGYQDHAITETAPGHSVTMSGRFPVHTGITMNSAGVNGVPDAAIIGTVDRTDLPASPVRFQGTTLTDWLKAANSATRFLSVSRKDRGAILPIGRSKGEVYWWVGSNGTFSTSHYYRETLPPWVQKFNARKPGQQYAGKEWTLLLPESAYPEPDSVPAENRGANFTFPHLVSDDSLIAARSTAAFPWMDEITLQFALAGLNELGLGGSSNRTDVLAVSLSTTDAIGHAFGPDSRELHDHLLRVDRWLGTFLDSLAKLVPREQTVFVLTGDHGIESFPEYTAMVKHKAAGRVSLDGLARETAAALSDRFEMDFGFDFNGNGLLIADTSAMHARGLSVDSLANALAAKARSSAAVIGVYTPRTLAAAPATDINALRWRHAIPREIPWLFCAVLKPGYVWSPGRLIAEHGTMSEGTVSVPIAFWGAGVVPHLYSDRARTVDIAPTLAAALGIRPSEPLDGHVLPGVFATPKSVPARR
jgi:predicted AlkP superfamily pyrophosphatase or phosphodiesterase